MNRWTEKLNWIQRNLHQSCGVKKLDFRYHFPEIWLALSKIVLLAHILLVPSEIIKNMQRIQNDFKWNSSTMNIKHETICSDFQNCGLKNADTVMRIKSLRCACIKRLYDESFHFRIHLAIISNFTKF